jgi:DNA-binding response OmpR family regulator
MRRAASEKETHSRANILIIDDNRDITYLLKIGLERSGFGVTTYNNPMDAVMDFSPFTYDLIILDIEMPGMDGFQVYQDLKNIDEKVKVCFFTALEEYEDGIKSALLYEGGSCQVLKKPTTIHALVEKVDQMLAPASQRAKAEAH